MGGGRVRLGEGGLSEVQGFLLSVLCISHMESSCRCMRRCFCASNFVLAQSRKMSHLMISTEVNTG